MHVPWYIKQYKMMKLEKVFKVYLMRDDPVTVFVPVFLKCANEAWVLKFLLNAKLILKVNSTHGV